MYILHQAFNDCSSVCIRISTFSRALAKAHQLEENPETFVIAIWKINDGTILYDWVRE